MKRIILTGLGLLSLALGIIGIFLPLLPTTPFLLISAACFMHSSQKLHKWLTGHKLFGKMIENYQKHRAISKYSKIIALIMLWASIGFSIAFLVANLWVSIALTCVAVGVTIHIIRIKTLTEEMICESTQIGHRQ